MNLLSALTLEAVAESRLELIWERARHRADNGRTRLALDAADKREALAMLRSALGRMKLLEAAADRDQANELQTTRETAEQIENVWIFSGVGKSLFPTGTSGHLDLWQWSQSGWPRAEDTSRSRIGPLSKVSLN